MSDTCGNSGTVAKTSYIVNREKLRNRYIVSLLSERCVSQLSERCVRRRNTTEYDLFWSQCSDMRYISVFILCGEYLLLTKS